MANRIQDIRVHDMRLDPAEADVWISVVPERLTSTTQVRGRLMGPRCPYSSTVEVAYPLREHSREYESTGFPHLNMRVIIPEANQWDPASPFLYEGPLELWQDGQLRDRMEVSHGLRKLSLSRQGLHCNNRLLTIRGVSLSQCSEAEARSLHAAGYNTVLAPASMDAALWDLADRFGFLVLARIADKADLKTACQRDKDFRKHACCLGWVVRPEVVDQELARVVAESHADEESGKLLGMELRQPPPRELPAHLSFVVCEERLLPDLAGVFLPKVLLRKAARADSEKAAEVASPGLLGWIRE